MAAQLKFNLPSSLYVNVRNSEIQFSLPRPFLYWTILRRTAQLPLELHELAFRPMSLHAVPWGLHAVPWAFMKFHELTWSSMNELAYSFMSLHAVSWVCMQFLSLSENFVVLVLEGSGDNSLQQNTKCHRLIGSPAASKGKNVTGHNTFGLAWQTWDFKH